MGRNLLSLQHFLHTPNSLQLPLKTMHHAAHSGMHIPYWSPRVFCAPLECPCGALSSASPNPHHAHWPNSHFPHGWCTIMCPPYTLSIDILSIFLHPGTATHVPNLVTSPHLDAVPHLITHILEYPHFNTGPTAPSFPRLQH